MRVTYYKDGIIIDGKKITLAEIQKEVFSIRQKKDNLIMVTINSGYWRGFDGIEETIICNNDERNKFLGLMENEECCFGEIAGKHSEVSMSIGECTVTETTNLDYNKVGSEHSFFETWLEDMFYCDKPDGGMEEELAVEYNFLREFCVKICE